MPGLPTQRTARQCARALQGLLNQLVLSLLVLGLAVPQLAYAADPVAPAAPAPVSTPAASPVAENPNPASAELEKRILDGVEAAPSRTSRLALSMMERNVGLINDQYRVDAKSDKVLSQLGRQDVSAQFVQIPLLMAQRGLQVDTGFREGQFTIRLTVEGMSEMQEIRLPRGQQVQKVVYNDELLYALMQDGSLHVIDVRSIDQFLFNAPVPVFFLGADRPHGHKVTDIKFVKRRVIPANKADKAQLLRLDRNADTLAKAKAAATPELVAQLERQIEDMRLPALVPELSTKLAAGLAETDPNDPAAEAKYLNSLQLALIADTEDGPRVVDMETATETSAKIAAQEAVLLGMMHLADPKSLTDAEATRNLTEGAVLAISETVSDPAKFQKFLNSGLQESLSLVDRAAVRTSAAVNVKAVGTIAKATAEKTVDATVDRFDKAAHEADMDYFQNDFLTQVRAASDSNQAMAKGVFAKIGRGMANKWKGFSLAKRMNNLVRAVAKPAAVATGMGVSALAADHFFFEGHGAAASIDALAGLWNWVKLNTVLQNPEYTRGMMTKSFTFQMGILAAIFGAFALARPFSQFTMNKLMTIVGIKYLFSFAMYPVTQIIPKLTGRMAAVGAAKQGMVAPRYALPFAPTRLPKVTLPKWLGGATLGGWNLPKVIAGRDLPQDHAEQPWIFRAFNRIMQSKNNYHQEKSGQIADRNRQEVVAGAVAICSWATKRGMSPFAALSSLAPSKEKSEAGREELASLTQAMVDIVTPTWTLTGKYPGYATEVAQALKDRPDAFRGMLDSLNAEAKVMTEGASQIHAGLLPYLRLHFSRQLVEGFAKFGEQTYREMTSPMPSTAAANVVVRSFIIDAPFSIVLTGMVGSWANLGDPEHLSYQQDLYRTPDNANGDPGSVGYTHPRALIIFGEQIGLHLGVMAAGTVAALEKAGVGLFQTSAPATKVDHTRTIHANGLFKELKGLAGVAGDIRHYNPLEYFGIRTWKQSVTLFSGLFVVGMLLRLLDGVFDGALIPNISSLTDPEYLRQYLATWKHIGSNAVNGQLGFNALAPYAYRWMWAVNIAHMDGLENNIKELGDKFEEQYLLMGQAIQQKDLTRAQDAAWKIIQMYDDKHRSIDSKIRTELKPVAGESVLSWVVRVQEICMKEAPVAERANEFVAKGYTFVASVATTIAASFLLTASFDERNFWGNPGADLSNDVNFGDGEWAKAAESAVESGMNSADAFAQSYGLSPEKLFMWKGVGEHNSIPLLMAKSIGTGYLLWWMGRAVNVAIDSTHLATRTALDMLRGTQNRGPKKLSDADLKAQLKAATHSLIELPGMRYPVAAAKGAAVKGASLLGIELPIHGLKGTVNYDERHAMDAMNQKIETCAAQVLKAPASEPKDEAL